MGEESKWWVLDPLPSPFISLCFNLSGRGILYLDQVCFIFKYLLYASDA